MKRQIKKIIFVAAVVALLGIAWLILDWIIPDDADDDTIYMTNVDATQYGFVSVQGPDSDYVFHVGKIEPEATETEAVGGISTTSTETEDPLYYLFDGGVFDDESKYGHYSQSELKKAFTRACQLEALDVVDEAPEDYSDYGLDKEHATVVMVTPYDDSDAESFTLLIGSHNEIVSGEGYYCQLVGDPTVYLVSTLNAGTFTSGPSKFMNTDVMPSYGEYYDEVKTLVFTNRAGESVSISRLDDYERDEEGEVIYTSFVMTAPYSCYVSDDIIGEDFLDLIANSQVMSVVALAPDEEMLSTYGFDNAGKVELSLVSGDITLYVAAPDGTSSGLCYYMVEGWDTIFMAYGEATYLDFTALDFRSSLCWLHDITLVSELDITTPEGSYTVLLDDTVDNSAGTGTWVGQITDNSTGKTVILSEDNGRALYVDCISTAYDDLMVDEENPIVEEAPSYTMYVKYKSGTFESKVSYYRVNSRQYAVLFDDADISTAGFTANVAKLKKINEDIQTILSGGILD